MSDQLLARRVRNTGASLLVVAFGSPRQEIWLDQNLEATGALVGVGMGAFLDFTAGRVRRAPSWMNALGIEWCLKLLQEPRRLWRRYLVGSPLFLVRAWRDPLEWRRVGRRFCIYRRKADRARPTRSPVLRPLSTTRPGPENGQTSKARRDALMPVGRRPITALQHPR